MNKYVTVKNNKTGITREITRHTYNLLKNKRIYTLIGEAPAPAAIKKSESEAADRVVNEPAAQLYAGANNTLESADDTKRRIENYEPLTADKPQRKKPGPKPKNLQNA